MNPISPRLRTGTIGELLVQLRLLQFDVQAAPPLKDSGNDLIAVHGCALRAIQVKTRVTDSYSASDLPKYYHILALVHLVRNREKLYLDKSNVFLIPKEKVSTANRKFSNLNDFLLTRKLVESLFKPRNS